MSGRFALGALLAVVWAAPASAAPRALAPAATKQLQISTTVWGAHLSELSDEQVTAKLGKAEVQSLEFAHASCYRTHDGYFFAPIKAVTGAGYVLARELRDLHLEFGNPQPIAPRVKCSETSMNSSELVSLGSLRLGMTPDEVQKQLGNFSGAGFADEARKVVLSLTYKNEEDVVPSPPEFKGAKAGRYRQLSLNFRDGKLVSIGALEYVKEL